MTPLHPAFPQPADGSAILWRYMNADKFIWLVTHGRLFMPRADQLGDPFEGSTPGGDLEWWREQVTNAQNGERRAIVEHNRAFLSAMAKSYRDCALFVSCWHMNQHENKAMWGCYTKGLEAVSIQTTYSALRSCLPAAVEMGLVRYLDYATGRLPSTNLLEHIMHKRVQLEFEWEVRAVAFAQPALVVDGYDIRQHLFELDAASGIPFYAPPVGLQSLIKTVVLHPDSTPTFESDIRTRCKDAGLPAPHTSSMGGSPAY
jgi:hypothetical protein